jgi:hypothetical protein
VIALTPEEQDVLLSAWERSSLWEVVASLRNVLPESEKSEAHIRARRILSQFGNRGWFELYRETTQGDSLLGDHKIVPLSELGDVLSDERNWRVPEERGEREFQQFGIGPSQATRALVESGAQGTNNRTVLDYVTPAYQKQTGKLCQ